MSNILALANTNSKICEWHGQGEGCQGQTVPGRNYCEGHLWRIYERGTAVRARPRKDRKEEFVKEFMHDLQEAYNELVTEGKIDA